MDLNTLIHIVYLLSATTFVLGFRLMRNPATAQRGNLIAAVGIVSAVAVTLMDERIERFEYVLIGLVAGVLGGARAVRNFSASAALPMIVVLNGLGGLAGLLVAWAEFHAHPAGQGWAGGILLWLAAIGGGIAFSGAAACWAVLQRKTVDAPLLSHKYMSRAVAAGVLATGLLFAMDTVAPEAYRYFAIFAVLSLILGAMLVWLAEKEDIPAIGSLLNGCSGLSACALGFVFQNTLLVAAGALVCGGSVALAISAAKAANRPLASTLAGLLGMKK